LGRNNAAAAGLITGSHPVENQATPVIAVPTTAGTGSEATRFATVYIDKTKHSLEHASILPVVTVVDPAFTMSLPPYQTAVTGMDALSQAVESFWSIRSTSESQELAARAIELVMTSLRTAVNHPDHDSRLNMIVAANLAGRAIDITKTTACHALSYFLTSHFGVPHGHAVCVTLSKMLRYNSQVTATDINGDRPVSFVQDTVHRLATLLHGEDVAGAAANIDSLMADIGLGDPIPGLKIDDNHIQKMVHDALNSNRMDNNPRKFTAESLTSLLNSVFL
jgi:alcohol dehydrogenase class IV